MTTCDSINSELGAVNSAANSINGKLDLVLSKIDALSNKVDSLQSKLDGLSNKIDTINNAIDSLENVLVTTINSIKDVLLAAINGLFGLLQSLLGKGNDNDLDRILQAIGSAKDAIIGTVGTQHNQTRQSISDCCNSLSAQLSTAIGLLNELLKKDNNNDTAAILAAIAASTAAIIAAIGALSAIVSGGLGVIEATLGEILAILLASKATDLLGLIGKILDLLGKLLGKKDCDLQPVLEAINSCCTSIQNSITQINSSITQLNQTVSQVSSKVDTVNNTTNQINSKADTINNTTNQINSTTNNISNAVNNISSQITNVYNQLTTINNNISNAITNFNNTSNSFTNISNDIKNITTTINMDTNQIINHVTNKVNSISPTTQQVITGSLSTIDCNGNTINHAYQNIQQLITILNNNINYITAQVCELDTTETELVEITVPIFTRCNTDREPEFNQVSVFVPQGLEETELLKFQRIAEIEGKQCNNEAIAVVPEWWQVRVEGGTPQFIMSFGEVDPATGKPTHAKYAITIPHFKNLKPEFCPIPTYKKGNYELIAYFKDNTKLIINAFNQQECERVYNSILPWIDESYLSTIKYKVGKRVSFLFKEVWVSPKFGKYFSMGNRELNPDWTVYFQ